MLRTTAAIALIATSVSAESPQTCPALRDAAIALSAYTNVLEGVATDCKEGRLDPTACQILYGHLTRENITEKAQTASLSALAAHMSNRCGTD